MGSREEYEQLVLGHLQAIDVSTKATAAHTARIADHIGIVDSTLSDLQAGTVEAAGWVQEQIEALKNALPALIASLTGGGGGLLGALAARFGPPPEEDVATTEETPTPEQPAAPAEG